ncbi:MAG TPA: PIN domain-containing protein [Beijerinckiaceae bacterium]
MSDRSPRSPSSVLIVDANIILSVVLGRRSRPVFERVVASRAVVTSARAADEVRAVVRNTPGLPNDAAELAEALLGGIAVVHEAVYADAVEVAAGVLAHAVASRNGSTRDAHLLACAWVFDADLWSHDRDFAGTGWPSWSNANLSDTLVSQTQP